MQFDQLRRREFITLLAGAAAWPLAARAQQVAMPVVGFVHIGSAKAFGHIAAAVRRGLADTGFIDGRNVAIEYRWAEGQLDRMPALVADLLHRQPAVIVAQAPAMPAVKDAAATIPIVF